jgi:protein-histidine pros-kinase
MKLALKFNLVFLAVFVVGLAAATYGSRTLLQRNAREETLQNARLIMEEALASRRYTTTQIAPLLKATPSPSGFLPQTVPAYGATEQFNTVHERFQDYAYKEATLNPTNPRDRAVEWEVDIVERFRQYPDQREIVGDRDTPSGRSVYLARPIQIRDPDCLVCHSTVDAAPKSMIDKYGPANGFGWRLNDVIGAQIVSVPEALPLSRAETAFKTFTVFLTTILFVLFCALNAMLRLIVVRPITRIARVADNVSLGKSDEPDLPASGSDELSTLSQSFNRMKKSLDHALKMLDDE